jgi:hypothetical protein
MPEIFIFAHVLLSCYDLDDEHPLFTAASDLWNQWLKNSDNDRKVAVLDGLKTRLKSLLCETQIRPL